jgi:hypothetical protein
MVLAITSPDDDEGARSDRAPRHPSHPAGGMVKAPVEELPADVQELSAEVTTV